MLMNKLFRIFLAAILILSATDVMSQTKAGKSGGLGDLLSGLANKFGVGSSSLTIEKMTGTWKYSGPAVSFKSDNLLLKAGGAAAATQVESNLEPNRRTGHARNDNFRGFNLHFQGKNGQSDRNDKQK